MDADQNRINGLNDLLESQYPIQHGDGWVVTKYTYYEDRVDGHQIEVRGGEDSAGGAVWTGAGPSPEQALRIAMLMAQR